jgi:hypothetical protein
MMASISFDSVAGKDEGVCELIRNDTRAFRVFNTSCLRPGIVQAQALLLRRLERLGPDALGGSRPVAPYRTDQRR